MDTDDPLGEIEKPVKTEDLCDILPEEFGLWI